jgi:hypothetical protein
VRRYAGNDKPSSNSSSVSTVYDPAGRSPSIPLSLKGRKNVAVLLVVRGVIERSLESSRLRDGAALPGKQRPAGDTADAVRIGVGIRRIEAPAN